jgi:virginiamycin B lyase
MRRLASLAGLSLALCASITGAAHGATCGNETLRALQGSGGLPDCRAFEQATPLDKGDDDATGTVPYVKAALGGGAVTFLSNVSSSALKQVTPNISTRTASGWSSAVLLPSMGDGGNTEVVGLTPDLSEAFISADSPGRVPASALLARSAADGALSTLVPRTPHLEPQFVGASEDGSLVVFEATAALPGSGPAIVGGPNLFAWDRTTGQVRLIGVLNNGAAPLEGAFGGPYDWILGTTESTLGAGGATRDYDTQDQQVVSASGTAVYFTAAGTGELYLRRNPLASQSPLDAGGNCVSAVLACTIEVSASQKTGNPPSHSSGAAAFMGASLDGRTALFTSAAALTDDANTGPDSPPAAIGRATVDGGSVEANFVPATATGVALDDAHLYWANPARGSISRADLDGTGVEEDFIGGLNHPRWVAVDGEHIYWTSARGTIGRARLDGGAPEPNFIDSTGKLQGIAVNGGKLYWADDGNHSIGRANVDGSGVEPNFHPLGRAEFPQGVAVDGSHIYWTENEPAGYVSRSNIDGTHETFQFIGFTAELRGIALDGQHVYWASQAGGKIGRLNLELGEAEPELISGANGATGLTLDDLHLYWSSRDAGSPGSDLYRYDAVSGGLTDLTPDPGDFNGAEVKGVLGVAGDGSYVYFAANGVLASAPNVRGETAQPGTCAGILGSASGTCNLYVFHAGTVSFIARLGVEGGAATSDAADWAMTPTGVFNDPDFQQTARVSADGRTLLFRSRRQLTEYASAGVPEFYRYSAGSSELICVSCDPSGAAPTAAPTLGTIYPPAKYRSWPAGALTRNLSASGDRVFFEAVDSLVEADRNGEQGCPRVGLFTQEFPACQDVYEWEAPGSGSCQSATANGGCLYLLSGASEVGPAFFADASASGNDAFIFTPAPLVDQDRDEFVDVYDARVNGGIAAQNEAAPTGCSGEACRPPQGMLPALTPPATIAPGSPWGRRRQHRCRRAGHTSRRRPDGRRHCGKSRRTHG